MTSLIKRGSGGWFQNLKVEKGIRLCMAETQVQRDDVWREHPSSSFGQKTKKETRGHNEKGGEKVKKR